MITLYPQPVLRNFRTINTQSFARRKKSEPLMTQAQVRAEASRITAGGLSAKAWRILDLLATGGILPSNHLPELTDRSMRNLCEMRVFERIAQEPSELEEHHVAQLGVKGMGRYLYMLGPVGMEIAATRHGVVPVNGYQAFTTAHILHDVMANEVVFRLAELLASRGWAVEWIGRAECRLVDNKGTVLLKPDALIRIRKNGPGGGDATFLLQYHNEDWSTHGTLMVERYEQAFSDSNWQECWEVESFPPVLVVFERPIVGAGYQAATKGSRKLNCLFYGKTLAAALDGKLDEWVNISGGMKKEQIFPK